ncbi:MAG: GntR family transcriptional regulator [Nocardiaceae bacterium]|nr:GntR family transcriptional regulator [Nocardiaceae bacterium]
MDLAPISRTAVSDTAYARILEEILTGRLPAGDTLPSERELALAFQVNRHAVREALKRVQQAGLIRISHGGKTRVLDWRENAGLETLTALAAAGVVPPLEIIRDVAQMRRSVGADAARLCAANASDEQLELISATARAYPEECTGEQIAEADLAFWNAVVDGSGNLAYRLALNSLVTAFDNIGVPLIQGWNADELSDRDSRVALAESIAARDGKGAYRRAEELLSYFVDKLASLTAEE